MAVIGAATATENAHLWKSVPQRDIAPPEIGWVTRIERTWLARRDREVRVTLERQSDPHQEPLLGWILFC